MLYICTGTDTQARKKFRDKLVTGFAYVEIPGNNDPLPVVYQNIVAGQTLFGDGCSVIIRGASEVENLTDFLDRHLDILNTSTLHLVLDDYEFTVSQEKFFKSKKITINVFDLPVDAGPNVFALTDALATGSKKTAWATYQNMLNSDISSEEMTAPIWWWLKNLGQTYRGVRDAKPFVQKKLDTAVKVFGDTVPDMLVDFCTAVDNARNGTKLEMELEMWILKSMVKN
jgi:hypothetical protein